MIYLDQETAVEIVWLDTEQECCVCEEYMKSEQLAWHICLMNKNKKTVLQQFECLIHRHRIGVLTGHLIENEDDYSSPLIKDSIILAAHHIEGEAISLQLYEKQNFDWEAEKIDHATGGNCGAFELHPVEIIAILGNFQNLSNIMWHPNVMSKETLQKIGEKISFIGEKSG